MISEEELRSKFEELRERRLSQRKSKYLSRNHRNCEYNRRMTVKGNGKCGFCSNPCILKHYNGGPLVCDEEGRANSCPEFSCRNTPESVEKEFDEILRDPARCGNEYPKLAILIWFLQDSSRSSRYERLKNCSISIMKSIWTLISLKWW